MNPVKKAIQMLRHAISRIVGGIQPTNLKGNYDDQPPVVSEGSSQAASPALSPSTRAQDVRRFYELLDRLAARIGGPRTFGAVDRRVDWPHRGVYFFFEPGEVRSGSGNGPRVVRVGTHALRVDSRSSLWGRLSEHRGTPTGGNHRGSVFRLLVGLALQSHDPRLRVGSWAKGASASGSIVEGERELEAKVSAVMGKMQLLWLPVEDEPGPRSLRSFIERNALALLSAYRSEEIDPPSSGWLGRFCSKDRIMKSGLWNSNHVDEDPDLTFLDVFEQLVEAVAYPQVDERTLAVAPGRSAPVGGNAERIIQALRARSDQDDDELSKSSGVIPRQQVNIICRRLEQEGILRRFIGARGKIVNGLVGDDQLSATSSSPARRTAIAQRTDLSSKDGASSLADVTVKITAEPTLLIIPCSGRKALGSQPSGTARALLDDLPADLASRLIAARNAVAVAAHLDESTLMPAWRRNAGTLYECAFLPGEDPEGMRWFKHLLILSGGYGVVRARDQIGTYDLAINESLWPRGLLQEVIVAYARREEIRHVIAIASQTTDYAKILRRVDWRSSGADTVMLLTPETAPGAMVKAPRAIGEALRTLTTTGLSRDWRSSDGLRMLQHLIFARVWP